MANCLFSGTLGQPAESYLSERQLTYMDKDEHEKKEKLSSLITNL